MPKSRFESIQDRELKNRFTYLKAWCEKCMSPFIPVSFSKNGMYCRCTSCYSTIKSYGVWMPCTTVKEYHEILRYFDKEKNRYRLALCPYCQHLWKIKNSKFNKKTQCPNCLRSRRLGSMFVYRFENAYRVDVNDELHIRIRSKYPKDYRYMMNFRERKEYRQEKEIEDKKNRWKKP